MNTLEFTTIGGKTYKVQFDEEQFFEYMTHCLPFDLDVKNQVALYLSNVCNYQIQSALPFDAPLPDSIQYNFSSAFLEKFELINATLKYNL